MWLGHILLYGSMTAIYIGVCAVVIILNKKIRRLADFLLDDLL